MVFSSLLFLYRFLPAALLIYYFTPRRFQNLALFLLSMFFYAWGEIRYAPIMLVSIAVDYTASNGIQRHRGDSKAMRRFLCLSLVGNLGMLGFFKYTDFFLSNLGALTGFGFGRLGLALPLGISFYTFQTMSYTIDVYRGKIDAEKNLVDFAAFVVLFPQLIAGPIVRYTDISRELKERRPNMEQITQGVKLFLLGLGSKVLIANNVGSLWTQVETGGFELISTPLAWLAVLAFSFQIYFDFSGYSLMAIGLGKMLGFDFPPNFNYPYISRSMTEFWRRWHMTLGAWFREYLYIPLGGNRLDTGRTVFNLFVVWAATGLWHGASWNFVLWGLYFFALIALERLWLGRLLARSAWLSYLYMIPLILVSWAIFAVPDFSKLGLLFSRMFVFAPGQDWRYYLRSYFVTLALAAVLSTPALRRVYRRMESLPALSILFFAGILLVSTAYLVDASYNPFLYFRF